MIKWVINKWLKFIQIFKFLNKKTTHLKQRKRERKRRMIESERDGTLEETVKPKDSLRERDENDNEMRFGVELEPFFVSNM